MSGEALTLEVAYALPARQTVLTVRIVAGATVSDALIASGIFELHPEARHAGMTVGIFGKIVGQDHQPRDGDRIEIYRPLIADPKATRHARVAKKRLAQEKPGNMRA